MRVVVYTDGNRRTRMVAKATIDGCRRHGVSVVTSNRFDGKILGDLVIAYGWVHASIFTAYPHYVYWDLGYWGRDNRNNCHRCAVDSWDTVTNMLQGCPSDRFDWWGFTVAEPVNLKSRNEILIAGMSPKAARTHGFLPGQWEREIKQRLEPMLQPGMTIRERDKPNRKNGVRESIETALSRTRLVVSHHSNVAIDALLAGVPSHVEAGIGTLTTSLLDPVNPTFPSRTEQLQTLYDAAYAQYSLAEMADGTAWNYIKEVLSLC